MLTNTIKNNTPNSAKASPTQKYKHALRMKTRRPIRMIERWLAVNCFGAWDVRLEDVSADLTMKAYVVFFALPEDVAAFKIAVRQPGMPSRADLHRRGKSRT